jgi:hypothetical protein
VREDHEETVATEEGTPGRVYPKDGLQIRLKTGESVHVELFPTMHDDALRRRLARSLEIGIESIHLHCDKQYQQRYTDRIRAVLPACRTTLLPDTPAGITNVTVRTELTVTDRYFRALAKIGFHYYLSYSLRGLTGSESTFAGIRAFITNGGDPSEYVQDRQIQFGENTDSWLATLIGEYGRCHLLGLEDGLDSIGVFVKMFHGDVRSVCYRITLGAVTDGWTYQDWAAHAFVYDNTQAKNGFAGTVHELP